MKDECFPVNQFLNLLSTKKSGKQCLKEVEFVLILRYKMAGDKGGQFTIYIGCILYSVHSTSCHYIASERFKPFILERRVTSVLNYGLSYLNSSIVINIFFLYFCFISQILSISLILISSHTMGCQGWFIICLGKDVV